jgi:hypothetical protein
MIRSHWYLAPVAGALALAGLTGMGPYGTPVLVLGVALGIFFGTVSLRGHKNPVTRAQSVLRQAQPDFLLDQRSAGDATSTHPGV